MRVFGGDREVDDVEDLGSRLDVELEAVRRSHAVGDVDLLVLYQGGVVDQRVGHSSMRGITDSGLNLAATLL